MYSKENALILLNDILIEESSTSKQALIKKFQTSVWDNSIESPLYDILGELAYDLDFYESDPTLRNEGASYYGEDGLKKEISQAIQKIQMLQVNY